MKKLTLQLDALVVESFQTDVDGRGSGTVHAHATFLACQETAPDQTCGPYDTCRAESCDHVCGSYYCTGLYCSESADFYCTNSCQNSCEEPCV